MSFDFGTVSRVEQMDRRASKLDAENVEPTALGDPGPLLDWIPETFPQLIRPDHHEPLTHAFERSLHSPVRFAYSAPVRHGKTVTLVCAIVWLLSAYALLGKGPPQIAFVTYAHQRAKEVARMIWQYARDAGHVFPQKGTVLEKFTSTGARIKCGGVFAAWTGDGFTHLVLDDLQANRQKAESPEQRATLIAALDSDIYTRKDIRGTSVFLCQARWNTEDAIAAATRKPVPFEYVNRAALGPGDVPLAPQHASREELIATRNEVGKYVWASLYQGEPVPREGALFVDAHPVPRLPNVQARVGIGIDLARTARTRSDYQALVVMRRHLKPGAKFFDIPEAHEMQGTITDRKRDNEIVDAGFARLLLSVVVRYPGCVVAWYGSAGEEWLGDLLVTQMISILGDGDAKAGLPKWRSLGVRVLMLEIASRDKWLRAQTYAAAWNDGRVRILETPVTVGRGLDPAGEPIWTQDQMRGAWQDRFIGVHRNFTGVNGGDDDWVDAAVAIFDELNKDGGPPDRGSLTTGVRSESESYGVDRI